MPAYIDMTGQTLGFFRCSDCSALVPHGNTFQHDQLHADIQASRHMAINGDSALRKAHELEIELAELRNQTLPPDPPLPVASEARPVLVDLTLLDGARHVRLGAIRWKGTTLAEVGMLLQPPNSDKIYVLQEIDPLDANHWYVELDSSPPRR